MPSAVPRTLPGFAIRAGCATLAAGLLALGTASPGRAADGGPSMEFSSPNHEDGIVTAEPFHDYSETFLVQGRNAGTQDVKNATVTIDATALKGQITMESQSCTKKGDLVIVCGPDELNQGKPVAPGAKFYAAALKLTALDGARPGFTGDVRVSAEAGGSLIGEKTFKAAVADLGLYSDRNAPDDGSPTPKPKPGTTVQPVVGFRNFSTRTMNDVYFYLHLTQGLTFAEEFSNCKYGSDYLVEDAGMVCHIKGTVEPGAAYDLDVSALKVGATAWAEHWNGTITDRVITGSSLHDPHQGTGRELKLTKRAQGPALPMSREVSGSIVADTFRDAEAVGATVDGKPGQVVKAELGLRNSGPATFKNWGEEPGDDATSGLSVTLPRGTSAVNVPHDCNLMTPSTSPTTRYSCHQDLDDFYFNAGQTTPFVFELRIDKPKALAPGTAKVINVGDNRPKNDSAPITVTVDGKLGDGSTPPAGGTEGSTSGGSTASPSTGASPASPSSDSSATTTSGGTGNGPMASTGAGAVRWYTAAAAVALAAGAALFTVARRRKAGRA
ncbi:hypothetical protein ACIRF8_31330 [Streptomyces sp. NPDC102406]|uniref:hypothetical protein n=1 Tax=Streptomyces sp. NPDC102406 TaxID=3366171 RepID=UPI00380A76DB